jgi:hypothetical protein
LSSVGPVRSIIQTYGSCPGGRAGSHQARRSLFAT